MIKRNSEKKNNNNNEGKKEVIHRYTDFDDKRFPTRRENFSSREGRIFEMERLNFAEGGKGKLAGKKLHRAHEQSKYLEESRGLAELGT